ncbi:MAG TPA: DMT family transporter [Steroidobacteraceae bacterium]|nr:DMT family transporter [Steroidobacteraceae bacterium]
MTHLKPRHLAFLVLINLIWGFNLIASEAGVSHFPPIFFTALRFTLLAALLLPFLRWHPGRMQRLLVAAALSGGVQYAILLIGIHLTAQVSSVAIASQLGVPFTTLISVLFLGEVIHWRRGLGILLAFVGVGLIAFQPELFAHRTGLALVVASALIGAFGLVAVKALGASLRPLELQAWFAISGLPALWLLTFWLEDGQGAAVASAGLTDWGALFYTVVIASLVAHTGYYWLIRHYPVTSLSPLTTLSPLFGVGFGVLIYGDPLTARLVFGGLLTLTGVTIIALRERRLVDAGS